MIIWINGAFGSGKTTLVKELRKRIKKSYIFDPEDTGAFIEKSIPEETKKDDFQDYMLWREINYFLLKYIDETSDSTIIVPMTIVNRNYCDEIIGRLKNDGVMVKQFILDLPKDILIQRIRERENVKFSWAEMQIDRCLDGLRKIKDAYHIDCASIGVNEKTDIILRKIYGDMEEHKSCKKYL